MRNKLGATALTVCPLAKIFPVFSFLPQASPPSFRFCSMSASWLQQYFAGYREKTTDIFINIPIILVLAYLFNPYVTKYVCGALVRNQFKKEVIFPLELILNCLCYFLELSNLGLFEVCFLRIGLATCLTQPGFLVNLFL